MAKLTQAQKEAFRNARASLAAIGTRVYFSRATGMMLAIIPTPTYRKDGQIVFYITTALCHPNDEFKKKLGLIELYDNYAHGHSTLARINHYKFVGFAERFFAFEFFEEMELD